MRERLPAKLPSPTQIGPEEELLLTLKQPVERPTLVLCDLSGNVNAVLHALAARGFVELQGKQPALSAFGKSARLVLNGDMNDRQAGFVNIIKVVRWLREQGADVVTNAGNHELFVLATLARPLPNEIPRWAMRRAASLEDNSNFSWTLDDLPKTLRSSIANWLFNNGGMHCVEELGKYYAETQPEKSETPAETSILERLLPAISEYEETPETLSITRRTGLLHALRAVRTPLIAEYFDNLTPLYRSNGLVFVHAFLSAGVMKSPSFAEYIAKAQVRGTLPLGTDICERLRTIPIVWPQLKGEVFNILMPDCMISAFLKCVSRENSGFSRYSPKESKIIFGHKKSRRYFAGMILLAGFRLNGSGLIETSTN